MSNTNQYYAFNKKTRKGKVIRLVKEKYLRADVGYGYLHGEVIYSETLRNLVKAAPYQHLLVIDTNIALHQIDALEYKCPATSLMIVLQTVLQELKKLNLSVYRRLDALMRDESRNFIFYPNEIASETNIQRSFNESMNDLNDKSIRTATKYYQAALDDMGRALLLSNDKQNRVRLILPSQSHDS
jgi:exosome complex exonuclease DIS3/RRP44